MTPGLYIRREPCGCVTGASFFDDQASLADADRDLGRWLREGALVEYKPHGAPVVIGPCVCRITPEPAPPPAHLRINGSTVNGATDL